jgi:hypothetical protein
MGRNFVVVAALAAFMVSMSACKCPTPAASSGGAKSSSDGSSGSGAAAGTAGGGTVCLDSPTADGWDGTACYHSEADRDMANLLDCSYGGSTCAGCGHEVLSCSQRMPGTHRATGSSSSSPKMAHGDSCDH